MLNAKSSDFRCDDEFRIILQKKLIIDASRLPRRAQSTFQCRTAPLLRTASSPGDFFYFRLRNWSCANKHFIPRLNSFCFQKRVLYSNFENYRNLRKSLAIFEAATRNLSTDVKIEDFVVNRQGGPCLVSTLARHWEETYST